MSILEYRPGTVVDRRLAERLQEAADAAEGFSGPEHRDIGNLASGREVTSIAYAPGKQLTFGEVVALAGDFFATYEQMRDLSGSDRGRAELAWARWKGLGLPAAEEPRVDQKVKDAVQARYYLLAGRNLTHFQAGGAAWRAYVKWHAAAFPDAFEAGEHGSRETWRRALTKEAFGHHFLTDMFSGGHVRTPRGVIQEWYRANYGDSGSRFTRYMAQYMFDRLEERRRLPWIAELLESLTRSVIQKRIISLGGEAVRNFTLGDIVGLALHDLDNRGLRVVSDVDKTGKRVPNGHPWTALGDAHLGSSAAGAETKAMAVAAAITSLRDLERVRGVGVKWAGRSLSTSARMGEIKRALDATSPTFVFAAKAFVPREDRTPGANTPYPSSASTTSPLEWRWGRLGSVAYRAVDETVRKRVSCELLDRIADVPDPVSRFGVTVGGTKQAYRAFCDHLKKQGIGALERAVGRKAR